MSSLTLKGKPSEQAPLASVTSSAPLTSTSSNASSGRHVDNLSFCFLCHLIANLGLVITPFFYYCPCMGYWIDLRRMTGLNLINFWIFHGKRAYGGNW